MLTFPPAYPHTHKCPHTCENVGTRSRRRGQYVGASGGKPRFRPLASRLYLHSWKLSPSCTHCTVQLFAFLVLIRRRCYAWKGIPAFLSKHGALPPPRRGRLLLSLSLEKRQSRKGTMVMAKQRSTSRCSIENATNAAIKAKWWLVTGRSFLHPPLHSSPPSFICKLVLRSGNGTTIPEPASIYVSIIIVLR